MPGQVRVWVEGSGQLLGEQVRLADGFASRFWGLMGQSQLPRGGGLWLKPCSSIHMAFMRFAIDAVFLGPEGEVLHVASGLRPWRLGPWVQGTRSVLELPAGQAAKAELAVGQRVAWSPA